MDNSKSAIITGASSGIGRELAYIAASKKMNLVLVARNTDKLQEMRREFETKYSISVLAVACDLSKAHAAEQVLDVLDKRDITPDVLINNAGFGVYGTFDETPVRKEYAMIQVNIVALTHLTKVIYEKMRKRGSGRILNVASIAGFMPGPRFAMYNATKAYVLSLTEALAAESKGTGVTLTALCPGPTRTNFETTAKADESHLFKTFKRFGNLLDPKFVAKYGWRCMMRGKAVAIPGCLNKMIVFATRLVPRSMVTAIIRRIQRPMKAGTSANQAKPENKAKTVNKARPTNKPKSGQPTKAANQAKTVNQAKTATQTKPANQGKPANKGQSGNQGKPANKGQSDKSKRPVNQGKQANKAKPKPAAQVKSDEPNNAAPSVNQEKPKDAQ